MPIIRRSPAGAKPTLPAPRKFITQRRMLSAIPADTKARLREEFNEAEQTIRRYKSKVRSPKTAIRAKCVECSAGSLKEVSDCRVLSCALHLFRNGQNPFHSKTAARMAEEGIEMPIVFVRKTTGNENEWQATINRYMDKIKSPKTAIRANCVDCCGGSLKEVAECPVKGCALHPFRMGQNPFHSTTAARLAAEGEDDDDAEEGADAE